jgi:hypothetical protein
LPQLEIAEARDYRRGHHQHEKHPFRHRFLSEFTAFGFAGSDSSRACLPGAVCRRAELKSFRHQSRVRDAEICSAHDNR